MRLLSSRPTTVGICAAPESEHKTLFTVSGVDFTVAGLDASANQTRHAASNWPLRGGKFTTWSVTPAATPHPQLLLHHVSHDVPKASRRQEASGCMFQRVRLSSWFCLDLCCPQGGRRPGRGFHRLTRHPSRPPRQGGRGPGARGGLGADAAEDRGGWCQQQRGGVAARDRRPRYGPPLDRSCLTSLNRWMDSLTTLSGYLYIYLVAVALTDQQQQSILLLLAVLVVWPSSLTGLLNARWKCSCRCCAEAAAPGQRFPTPSQAPTAAAS